MYTCSCRNGERTAPHAHQRWTGAALQPHEHYTTGNGIGNMKSWQKNKRHTHTWTDVCLERHHFWATAEHQCSSNSLETIISSVTVLIAENSQIASPGWIFTDDLLLSVYLFFFSFFNRAVQYNQDFYRVEIWTALLCVKVITCWRHMLKKLRLWIRGISLLNYYSTLWFVAVYDKYAFIRSRKDENKILCLCFCSYHI